MTVERVFGSTVCRGQVKTLKIRQSDQRNTDTGHTSSMGILKQPNLNDNLSVVYPSLFESSDTVGTPMA